MALRKSTKVWLGLFAAAVLLIALDPSKRFGPFAFLEPLAFLLAIVSSAVLIVRGTVAAFRLITRRLALRLAFSYFLIGILPIPLVALLLLATGYVFAFQIIAARVERELTAIGEEAAAGSPGVRVVEITSGTVKKSSLPWLPEGQPVSWAESPDPSKILLFGEEVWLATRRPEGALLVPVNDPSQYWLQRLADRTGYAVLVEAGTSRESGRNYRIRLGKGSEVRVGDSPVGDKIELDQPVRPHDRPRAGRGMIEGESLVGVFPVNPVASFPSQPGEKGIALFIAKTSPRALFDDLIGRGIRAVGNITAVILWLASTLLVVYLVALAIAFVLVGTIARNVNRLTRASQAISRGDFSVRVQSKSRDQIGDLARSFDGMAASIQSLLVETAKKERLEGEIAVARTIQQKLLPAPAGKLPGFSFLALFQPLAEIGGDYYDYFPMPDGRTAVVAGDVSGHGLSTGLLAAMAKASLSTLIETGLTGSPLFARLNDLIHRSTDSRNYMTLAMLAYDSVTREGELSNAGQLAPYRVGRGGIQSLSLPSFPLGASPRADFPTKSFAFEPGDLVLFFTDGFVEALDPEGEPFGFERLEALLRRKSGASAEELRDALLAEIQTHSGGRSADDDRTLIFLTLE